MRPRCDAIMISCVAFLLTLVDSASLLGFQATNAQPGRAPLSDFSRSIRALTSRVSPAVVKVDVSGYGPAEEGAGRDVALMALQKSTGSGVIVDPEGYIVTNAHVVRGAISVRVVFVTSEGDEISPGADGSIAVNASIAGIDRETDLALIKVDRRGLPALPFGDSDTVQQGDIVLAIGSPLGLKNSVSMGVVSAPARQMSENDAIAYIQTDASINPGNSGGALVNADGQLMGINSFILTQSGGNEGIGFAIPSNIVQNVYQQLRTRGHVHRGDIGVVVQNITPILAAGLSLPRSSGVIIADVDPDGPADTAGLKQGDIVLALDGHVVDDSRQFETAFYRRQKGEKVTVRVLRGGKEQSINVEVDEQEDDDDFLRGMVSPEKNLVPRLGILCVEIDSKMAKLLPDLRRPEGLVVAAKSQVGQGRYIDLQQGDVIHEIDAVAVSSLDAFRSILNGLKPGAPVVLLVEREGAFHYIGFEIE